MFVNNKVDPSKQIVQSQVLQHKNYIKESLKTLQEKMDIVMEYSYSGDVVSTIRAVHRLKDETEHLYQTIDHLLLTIEKYGEPDHGGE